MIQSMDLTYALQLIVGTKKCNQTLDYGETFTALRIRATV